MRRWEVVIAAGLVLLASIALLIWIRPAWQEPTKPTPVLTATTNSCQARSQLAAPATTTINRRAPIAANGKPLPAASNEDVVIELTTADAGLIIISYDADGPAWVIDYPQSSWRPKLCVIDGIYFLYNALELVWDQVDYRILNEDIREITTIDNFLFNQSQMTAFVATATSQADEACGRAQCAVWLAANFWNADQVVVRVNKQTRKIEDINLVGGPQPQTAFYNYQPVEIKIPTPVRWLKAPQ